MVLIEKAAHRFLQNYQPESVWVAYSGGVDSHVLLYVLKQLQSNFNFSLQAVHVNHGLSNQAPHWHKHCEQVCQDLEIPFSSFQLTLNLTCNLEAEARRLRHQIYQKVLKKNECLLTAHHQDDQAETLLLHLFRGAGVRGLAAMPEVQPFALGALGRPLLTCSKEAILSYARSMQLQWIEDPSNQDTYFSRNLLRNQLMPWLRARWPQATRSLTRTAYLMQEQEGLLKELAEQDLKSIQHSTNAYLLIEPLKQLSMVRQKNVLRYWIVQNKFLLPTEKRMQLLIKEVINTRRDATPIFEWDSAQIRGWHGRLYLLDKTKMRFHGKVEPVVWHDLKQSLKLPAEQGELTAKKKKGSGLLIEANAHVEVRFREGGEQVLTEAGRRPLKKLLQESEIPIWERDRIPLVYVNGKVGQIMGLLISEEFKVGKEIEGYEISWEQKSHANFL